MFCNDELPCGVCMYQALGIIQGYRKVEVCVLPIRQYYAS